MVVAVDEDFGFSRECAECGWRERLIGRFWRGPGDSTGTRTDGPDSNVMLNVESSFYI